MEHSHDELICGLLFEDSCLPCQQAWLDSDRVEEIPLADLEDMAAVLADEKRRLLAQVELARRKDVAKKAAEKVWRPRRSP